MPFNRSDGDVLYASDLDEFNCTSIDSDGGNIVADTIECDSVDLGGGEIDNTVLGDNTPSPGNFTTLSATGACTVDSIDASTGEDIKIKTISASFAGSSNTDVSHGLDYTNIRGVCMFMQGLITESVSITGYSSTAVRVTNNGASTRNGYITIFHV